MVDMDPLRYTKCTYGVIRFHAVVIIALHEVFLLKHTESGWLTTPRLTTHFNFSLLSSQSDQITINVYAENEGGLVSLGNFNSQIATIAACDVDVIVNTGREEVAATTKET